METITHYTRHAGGTWIPVSGGWLVDTEARTIDKEVVRSQFQDTVAAIKTGTGRVYDFVTNGWRGAVGQENKSDGSTASYYELPPEAKELQTLISFRNMNAQIGEIFRACYRYGLASHSDQLRDAKKILFYAKAEVERLESLTNKQTEK